MGRTSKFLFPIPSRKNQTNRAAPPTPTTRQQEPQSQPQSPAPPTPGLSKAQRILGTDGGLNIDTLRPDEHAWKRSNSNASGMSISISESTDGSDDEAAGLESWDAESGVLQPPQRLKEKASSTALSQTTGRGELATDTSSLNSRLRNECSSSTLRSHYERQKNPLSISQQTSSSSARDLALRKGLSTAAGSQRSPLFKVDYVDESKDSSNVNGNGEAGPKSSKKKPVRLDLSKLFPKPRQNIANPTILLEPLTQSPSALSFISTRSNGYHFPRVGGSAPPANASRPEDEHVAPKGSPSKLRSQYSVQSLQERYGNRKNVPAPGLPPAAIPPRSSSKNVYSPPRGLENMTGPQLVALHTPPPSLDSSISPASKRSQFSWKHVRASIGNGGSSTGWDSASAISTSSLNTRTSKKTTGSAFETADLRNHSVLSLSSDEDSEASDDDGRLSSALSVRKPSINHVIAKAEPLKPPPVIVETPPKVTPPTPAKKSPIQRIGTAKIPKSRFQDTQFLPIPVPSIPQPVPVNPRISGPWNDAGDVPTIQVPNGLPAHIQGRLDTPPVSPTSIEFRQAPGRSSRFMAVNKQERALLEALRQKRTKMKEDAIQEHYLEEEEEQTKKAGIAVPSTRRHASISSVRQPHKSQSALSLRDNRDSKMSTLSGGSRTGSIASRSSSQNTIRGATHGRSQSISSGSHAPPVGHKHKRSTSKGNILLILERSDIDIQAGMQTAEPSPDLSEFYRDSFGLGDGYKYHSDDEADEEEEELSRIVMTRDPTPREILRIANRRDSLKKQRARDSKVNLYDGYGYGIPEDEEDEEEEDEEEGDVESGFGDFSPTKTVPSGGLLYRTRLAGGGRGMGSGKGRYPQGGSNNGYTHARQDSLASVEEEAATAPYIRLRAGQRGYGGSVSLGPAEMGVVRNIGRLEDDYNGDERHGNERNGNARGNGNGMGGYGVGSVGWATRNEYEAANREQQKRYQGRSGVREREREKILPEVPPIPKNFRMPPIRRVVGDGSQEWEKEVVVYR